MGKKKKKDKKIKSSTHTKQNIFLNFIKPQPEVITIRIFTIYDYLIGILVFFFSFFIYLHTLTPTIDLHDSGDMIGASFVLGIPHPPGYPLYCLLGKLFSLIPIGNIAYRYNLFSATAASLAVMMVYFITLKVVGGNKNKNFSLLTSYFLLFIPAIVSAFMLCFAPVFWQQAVIAEKYTLNALFATIIIFILLKWQEITNHRLQITDYRLPTKYLYLFAFILGLSFTHHLQTIFLVPASIFLIIITWRKNPKLLTLNSILKMAVLFFLPLILYAYLPIRASAHPVINWGCPDTFERFIDHITAKEYGYYFSASLSTLLNRIFVEHPVFFIKQFTPYLIWIGFVGLFFFYKHKIKTFTFLLLIVVADVLHSSRYGIHNIEDYYIPAYIIFSIFIGYGVMVLIDFLNKKLKQKIALLPYIFLFIPAISYACNRYYGDHSKNYYSYDYGMNILFPLEDDSILYIKGDTFAFPLWYLHYVENIRKDITLIDQHSLYHDWYANQLKKELDFDFKPQNRVKRLNDEAMRIIKVRFDAIFKNNQHRPIYLPYDERIAAGYTLVPTGICHRVFKKGTPLTKQMSVIDKDLRFRHRFILDESIYKEERVASNISNYATAYNNRGNFFKDMGRYDDAIAEYKKAICADPKRLISYYNIGMIYNDLGKTQQAISEFNKIIQLDPNDAKGYYGLGLVYQKMGDIDRAIKAYEKAASLDPERDFIHINLGSAYISKGKLNDAVAAFQKAIAISPQNIAAIYNLGIAYSQLGKRLEAISSFQKVLSIDPNYQPARNSLMALQR
jgi:tetratricopeptide (TPR) repeat protein